VDELLKELAEDRKSVVQRFLAGRQDVLLEALKPYREIAMEDRLHIALSIMAHLYGVKKRGSFDEKLFKEAITLVTFIVPLEQEKSVLMKLLMDFDPPLLYSIQMALLSHITHHRERQKFLLFWNQFATHAWQAEKSPRSALLLAEHLTRVIVAEDLDLKSLSLPGEKEPDPRVREILRRSLLSIIHGGRGEENTTRARKALVLMKASETSEKEKSFDPFQWKTYQTGYLYEIGIDEPSLLLGLAEECLEEGEENAYASYGAFFTSSTPRLRVESAYAFIQACQFRTRKPRGPAERYRSEALKVLKKAPGDPSMPPELLPRILVIGKSLGHMKELISFLADPARSGELKRPAVDALLSCWIEMAPGKERDEYLQELVPLLVELVKGGGDDPLLFDLLGERLSAPGAAAPLRDLLRRNLKILLADTDCSAGERKNALQMLGGLGQGEKKAEKPASAMVDGNDDESDEGGDEEPPPEKADIDMAPESFPVPAGLGAPRRVTLPGVLEEFLGRRDRSEALKAAMAGILSAHYDEIIGYYLLLFSSQEEATGRMLFEHILAAARSLLEHLQGEKGRRKLKKGELQLEEKAREALFWTFFYRDCPDLVKMESFEYLNSIHYLEAMKADTLKRYALSFARDAIANRAQSAACRALADLINLRTSGRSLDGLAGKTVDALLDDFIAALMKEKSTEKLEKWITLLHYVTFQEPRALAHLAERIHPLHYNRAIDILTELAKRYNWSAGSLLIDAAGNDYTDIRNRAVTALSALGHLLWPEQKERLVPAILEKLDDCYDEEARTTYLETMVKVDPECAARHLVERCLQGTFHERRELLEVLMKSLERLTESRFMAWCDQGDHMARMTRIITTPPVDTFMKNQARRFMGLFRENYLRAHGKDSWETFQHSEGESRLAALREISKVS